jgi:hypothetical protein
MLRKAHTMHDFSARSKMQRYIEEIMRTHRMHAMRETGARQLPNRPFNRPFS